MGTWLRNPHTTPERRVNGRRGFIEVDGYRIKIRPRRNFINLPQAWDDIVRKDLKHKSWKRSRKTQHK